jgi:hydroxyethylthiazole kinase-like uncharacterized protein yjeF
MGEVLLQPQFDPAPNLVVDALFGVGFSRPISPDLLMDIWVGLGGPWPDHPMFRRKVVSIDIPSGVCADSGRVIFEQVTDFRGTSVSEADLQIRAGLTVTFQTEKLGHHLSFGASVSGQVKVVALPLENAYRALQKDGMRMDLRGTRTYLSTPLDTPFVSNLEKYLRGRFLGVGKHAQGSFAPETQHKYSYGHALILSGGVGKGGAARLAARGALRIGAGLVTVGAPPAAVIENAAQLNAIMLRPVADADALAEILKDDRINALCLGPGLGVGAHTLGLVAAALGAKRGTVLDADALTSFAEDPSKLFALLHKDCVLTPHMGEFGRLFPDIAARLDAPATKGPAYSKVDAAREAAARAGCVVLLKGPDTVIADQGGRCAINSADYERVAPWLATAGSGDVLAGMITGLLARGFAPMAAAETAAWLHVEAACKFGPGLIAEDIPEMIPAVFRDLGL